MRRLFRELFARVPDLTPNLGGINMAPTVEEVESGYPLPEQHPPSIYDGLIAGLEGDVIGLKSLLDYHSSQLETLETTLQHKREQLAVLQAHRDEERGEPPPYWDGHRFHNLQITP